MTKKKINYPLIISLILIFAASLFFRTFKLGNLPSGLTEDEASIAYNAFSIGQIHHDEWLVKMPFSFRAYGEYKTPLPIYLDSIFILLFGFSPFITRLPFALASVAGLVGFYLLANQILPTSKYKNHFTLLATFSLAFCPAYFFFSRGAWEGIITVSLTIWGVYFFFIYLQSKQPRFWQLALSALCFVLTFYTYSASKLATPLLILALFILFFRQLKKQLLPLIAVAVGALLTLIPFIYDSLRGGGLERANISFLLDNNLSIASKISQLGYNFLLQLNPLFLIGGAATTNDLSHNVGDNFGVFLLPTFLLFLVGIFFAIKTLWQKNAGNKRLFLFLISWLIIGILPATIASDAPHILRAIVSLPAFVLIAIFGLHYLFDFLQRHRKFTFLSFSQPKVYIFILCATWICLFINAAIYLNYYFTTYAKISGDHTQYQSQTLEVSAFVANLENEVEQIIFTDEYPHPYIYLLLAKKADGLTWQHGALNKYLFTNQITLSDLEKENVLIVVGERYFNLFTPQTPGFLREFQTNSGLPRYRVFLTKPTPQN